MRTSPSQPSSDRTNLALLGRINRPAEHDREDAMTRQKQRDQDAALSRRTLVQGLALGAATFAGAGSVLAQTGPAAPPTTINTPPRGPRGPTPGRRARGPRSPPRHAISAPTARRPPISGTPTSSRSIRPST